MYNYRESMRAAIEDYLEENIEYIDFSDFEDVAEFRDTIYHTLFESHRITGARDGSYTYCRNTAKEYIADNLDLVSESFREYNAMAKLAEYFCDENYEMIDVNVRCYLLGEVLWDYLEEPAIEEKYTKLIEDANKAIEEEAI